MPKYNLNPPRRWRIIDIYMRIGIDVSRYRVNDATGIEWYSYHLINNLIPILGRFHKYEFLLYSNKELKFDEDLPFNVKIKIIKPNRLWTFLGLSKEMIFYKPDILFVPSYWFPFFIPKKSIITIHDIAFMIPEVKNSFSMKERVWQKWGHNRAIRKAYKIIVPSNSTKQDLIKYFHCPEKKIKGIYHGRPEWALESNPILKKWGGREVQSMFKKFGINEKDMTMLYIGRIEEKKNLINLISAFSRFLKEYPDWKLILAGKNGFGAEKIKKSVEDHALNSNIIFTDYITEEEKLFLLEKSRIFVFVSKYEGFGLPILEAWAVRRPVVTSNISAMKEIGEGAAILVDPNNVAGISVGLKRLVFDAMLKNKLVNGAEEKLNNFNWEKTAEQTIEVLLG